MSPSHVTRHAFLLTSLGKRMGRNRGVFQFYSFIFGCARPCCRGDFSLVAASRGSSLAAACGFSLRGTGSGALGLAGSRAQAQ